MTNPPTNHKRNPQFFESLPSDVIIDILSRLPVRSIVRCKCVRKAWLNLLQTREFADFHLSRSASGLIIHSERQSDSNMFRIFEFDDRVGLEHHDLHYNPVVQLEPFEFMEGSLVLLQGSSNGLLLLRKIAILRDPYLCDYTYVCNPITREYIELPNDGGVYSYSTVRSYGFGVSKMTSQHKVVSIFHYYDFYNEGKNMLQTITRSICLVYVLGTGIWRDIAPPAPCMYGNCLVGVSLNGNVYWLVQLSDGCHCISCFDLDTEIFSTFSLPPLPIEERPRLDLVALGGFLCVSDNRFDGEVVIWSMKDYGEEKSWIKAFVIRKSFDLVSDQDVHPIKVFSDGDILMSRSNLCMFYYCNKTKTTTNVDIFGVDENKDWANFGVTKAMLHTPSFLSLRSFIEESVTGF